MLLADTVELRGVAYVDQAWRGPRQIIELVEESLTPRTPYATFIRDPGGSYRSYAGAVDCSDPSVGVASHLGVPGEEWLSENISFANVSITRKHGHCWAITSDWSAGFPRVTVGEDLIGPEGEDFCRFLGPGGACQHLCGGFKGRRCDKYILSAP